MDAEARERLGRVAFVEHWRGDPDIDGPEWWDHTADEQEQEHWSRVAGAVVQAHTPPAPDAGRVAELIATLTRGSQAVTEAWIALPRFNPEEDSSLDWFGAGWSAALAALQSALRTPTAPAEGGRA